MVGMDFYGMVDAGCLKTKNAWAASAHPTLLESRACVPHTLLNQTTLARALP